MEVKTKTNYETSTQIKPKLNLKKWKKYIPGYLFILPNLIFVCVFLIYPLFETFKLSFYDASINTSTFVGLQNYVEIFNDDVFLNSVKNTFYFALLIVPIIVVAAFTLAAIMKDLRPKAKSFFRTLFYLPVISTPVVLTMVWAWMYDTNFGIINYFTSLLGFSPFEWLGSPTTAVIAIALVVSTWSLGQPIILYLASMDGIPKELYEAADMDGAGPMRKFFNITLPLVANTSLFVTITTTIAVFQIFVVIYLLTGGGPYYSTETLVFTIYRTAFTSLEFGKASAQGTVLFIIIMIISLIQLKFIKSKTD
jgi:multiple sugar transport system permease protein